MHATICADLETQDRASQLRRRILKLRWMGMEREADELARSALGAILRGVQVADVADTD